MGVTNVGIEGEGIDRNSIDENGYPKPQKQEELPPLAGIISLLFLGGGIFGLCYIVYLIATWLMN